MTDEIRPMQWLLAKGDFNKNIQTLNSFVEPFVRQTLEMKPEQLKEKTEKEYNFLHALAEFTRDPQMLRDQLVAVLLAARDTTAATLSWTVYELSKQPKIVERLRKDIMDVLGPDTLPTYTDLKDMKYLQHIINEILRLYPASRLSLFLSSPVFIIFANIVEHSTLQCSLRCQGHNFATRRWPRRERCKINP